MQACGAVGSVAFPEKSSSREFCRDSSRKIHAFSCRSSVSAFQIHNGRRNPMEEHRKSEKLLEFEERRQVETTMEEHRKNGFIEFRQQTTRRKPKQRNLGMREWESKTGKNTDRRRQHSMLVTSVLEDIECSQDVCSVLEKWSGKIDGRHLSKILKEQPDWAKALQIFEWIDKQQDHKPDIFHYNILLRTLGKAKKWELVQAFWNRMLEQKLSPTNITYSTLLDVYGRAGMKQEARFYYDHMLASGLQPDEVMVSTFLNFQRRFGELLKAEEAFWGLFTNGRRPKNPETYNTMITLYGEKNKYVEATRVFTEMAKSNVEPTTVTFNAMIRMYGKLGRFQDAEDILVKMLLRRNSLPDVVTYNTLLEMYVQGGKMECVFGFLKRMCEAGVLPDQVTYRTLISAYSSQGDISKAEATIREMEVSKFRIDEGIYTAMISLYIRSDNFAKAENLFEFLRQSKGLEVGIYVSMIDAYGERNMPDHARRIFDLSLKNGSVTTTIYNVMIKAYGLRKMYSEAVELYEGMVVEANEATFNTMVQLLCKATAVYTKVYADLLGGILLRMKRTGFKLGLASGSSIIKFFTESGRFKEAEDVFYEMVNSGVKVDKICYTALLNAYAEAGYAKEAQETLNRMKSEGLTPDEVVYTSLMKLYGNLGLKQEAENILSEIRGDSFAANTMLGFYVKWNMIVESENLFKTMPVNNISCTMMMKLYRENGMVDRGLKVAMLMGHDKDAAAFNELIGMYIAAGFMREGILELHRMKEAGVTPTRRTFGLFEKAGLPREMIQSMEDNLSGLKTMAVLTWLYAEAGMSNEAVEIAFGILEAGETDQVLDVDTYNALIYAFGKSGKLDLALKVYTKMQGDENVEVNELTYGSVILAYGKAGLMEGVGRIFRRLKECGFQPSERTYQTVIEVYREGGRMDLASMVSQEMHFAQYVIGGMQNGQDSSEE